MERDLQISDVIPFLIVSLFWGITNPFIERSSRRKEEDFKPLDFSLSSLFTVLKRWSFIVPFGVNQIGSIIYGYLLGIYPEQFSCLSANALTVLVTFLTERAIKRRRVEKKEWVGMSLIVGGIFLIV